MEGYGNFEVISPCANVPIIAALQGHLSMVTGFWIVFADGILIKER